MHEHMGVLVILASFFGSCSDIWWTNVTISVYAGRLIFSERERKKVHVHVRYAVAGLSVCLSVTLVHPTRVV